MLLAVQNRLVMFGGCNFNAHTCYNETHIYEPSAQMWEQLPHHPARRLRGRNMARR